MWNPTTNTSDNKKSDDDVVAQQQQPPLQSEQQQQLEINKVNTQNIQSTDSTVHPEQQINLLSTNRKSQEEQEKIATKFEEQITETTDSGFISGPQSEYIQEYEQESHQEDEGATERKHKSDIESENQKQQDQESNILDSGCIAEDDDENYSDIDEAKLDKAQSVDHNIAAINSDRKTSIKSDCATTESNNEQMLIKDVASISDRFGKLVLHSDTDAVQRTPGMNNLNNSEQRTVVSVATATATSAAAALAATAATNNANTTTTTVSPYRNLTPANAWEEFYKQNDDGDTPLHLACISGEVEVVIALLRMAPHPSLFNIQNDTTQTPLHFAALTKQPRLLRMLLLAGAEPTIRDQRGNTALHIACNYGDIQCVHALTSVFHPSEIDQAHRSFGHRTPDKMSVLGYKNLPSDLEISNYDGERCVHLAAQQGHIEILRILKNQGADINAREGKSGLTPLHIAIECCNEDLANFLLDECEKLNLETATYASLTAYQFASIANKSQMQNILKKHGAEPLTPPDSESDYEYDSDYENDLDESKMFDPFGDAGYFVGYSGDVRC